MADEICQLRLRVRELEAKVEGQRREIDELRGQVKDMEERVKLARSQPEGPEGGR